MPGEAISYTTLSEVLKFMATAAYATMNTASETAKSFIEFERQLNAVGGMFENIPAPVHCPCELLPFEEMVDTGFLIPITKNDTPASIAEAIVKGLERRY